MVATETLSINTGAEVVPTTIEELETPLTDTERATFDELTKDLDDIKPEMKEQIQKIDFAKGNGKHELTWDTKLR